MAPAASAVITRSDVITRAQSWVNADPKVSYSQTGTYTNQYGTYRRDCSGFVSMAWGLASPGRDTSTLSGVASKIAKSDLQSGDILLNNTSADTDDRHVVLFASWANGEKTHYWGYEQAYVPGYTVYRMIPYPYNPDYDPNGYVPYRYNNIGSNPTTSSSLARNGGFEQDSTSWKRMASTNFVVYDNGTARSARKYAATNTSVSGGGIYQDVAVPGRPGDLYCATAYLRTQGTATGARGKFVVWLLGGSYNESGQAAFRGLSNGSNWSPRTACVAATTPQSTMRIQFYPDPGSPTLDIDDVTVL